MNILITGGAGFIGKHLIKFLLEKNYNITILDNFSNSRKNSLSDINNNMKIIDGDITKNQDVLDAVKNQDIVIHLAAKISVPESIKNPVETFKINVDGTKNILTACKINHVKKLIVASSAAVYGESSQNIKLTENSKMNPISPYGQSKVKMEQEIKKNNSESKMDCIVLRFFNLYGVGQSEEYAGVISKFLKRIKQEKQIEIFGDGMQTRDFVSIKDIVSAIHTALLKNKSGTYNIASGEIFQLKDIAKLMIAISGKKLSIKYLKEKKGDIRFSSADISLAKKELGYDPKIQLKEGLKQLLK
ncbi:MAG: NAD-dependent dehydratase [Thaumarchaeota archaeon]|jgi:UDP-glucose 4-epimerase|nr:MAG: NAD-dependent dehydratase [Nitrososphaerota archaeon]